MGMADLRSTTMNRTVHLHTDTEYRTHTPRDSYSLDGSLLAIAALLAFFTLLVAPEFILGAAIGAVGPRVSSLARRYREST